jgi:hypothetical protein
MNREWTRTSSFTFLLLRIWSTVAWHWPAENSTSTVAWHWPTENSTSTVAWHWAAENSTSTAQSGRKVLNTKREAMYVERNIEARSCSHCCSGQGISITHSERVIVALTICNKCACTVFYFHLWPVWLYRIFPHYLSNGTIFEKKSLWKKNVCFDFSRNLSETTLILRRIQWYFIFKLHRSSCKVPITPARV